MDGLVGVGGVCKCNGRVTSKVGSVMSRLTSKVGSVMSGIDMQGQKCNVSAFHVVSMAGVTV